MPHIELGSHEHSVSSKLLGVIRTQQGPFKVNKLLLNFFQTFSCELIISHSNLLGKKKKMT